LAYRIDENGEYKRSVRCGHCYEVGHNKLSCPTRLAALPNLIKEAKEEVEETTDGTWERNYANRRLRAYEEEYHKMTNRGKNRVCGFCRKPGHNRATCPERKEQTKKLADETIALRKHAARMMQEAGYGIGSLVQVGIRNEEPVMAIVTGVQFEDMYSRDHKYNGGSYFYPPNIIQYQLVRPQVNSYNDTVTTHGRAYMPAEFLNPDGHELPPGIAGRRSGAELISDVTCDSLLSDEATDHKKISQYVLNQWVDPK